ncbi:hypothetical protein [Tunicatimonas pelagia]|uniref:hypothetical protein n=1 Tax=Tunicatimonas pelagia TaxID=931531 RepID=UPI0026654BB5|nr:hypothetical protein [Tunicatimonas pelagia]WKN45079.1 hypothetical protein P0M28_08890 [Tunicatimonas pelagia]
MDERTKLDSITKSKDKYQYRIRIKDLHRDGIVIKDFFQNQKVSLQIFTAKNANKIKVTAFVDNKPTLSLYQDRLTLGSWDSAHIYSELAEIQKTLVRILNLETRWDISDKPDTARIISNIRERPNASRFQTIDYQRSNDKPIFLNATVEEPALFTGARNESESKAKINQYIIDHTTQKGVKFEGQFSGAVVISETGEVVSFVSSKMNRLKVEKAIEEIILSMPTWKVAYHQGKPVQVSQIIFIGR